MSVDKRIVLQERQAYREALLAEAGMYADIGLGRRRPAGGMTPGEAWQEHDRLQGIARTCDSAVSRHDHNWETVPEHDTVQVCRNCHVRR